MGKLFLFAFLAIHLSLGNGQLANFNDLVRLAKSNTNSISRSDRSLANSYPFNLGERQSHHHKSSVGSHEALIQARAGHIGHQRSGQHGGVSQLAAARQAAVAQHAATRHSQKQTFSFGFGGQSQLNNQLAGVQVQQQVAAARQDSLPLHTSVQQQLLQQHQQNSQLLTQSGFGQRQRQSVQHVHHEQQHIAQPVQHVQEARQQLSGVYQGQVQYQAQTPAAVLSHQGQHLVQGASHQQSFIGPATAPSGYHQVSQQASLPAPVAHPELSNALTGYASSLHDAAPVITVTDDAIIAVDAAPARAPVPAPAPAPVLPPNSCPAPSRLPHQCGAAVNTCWSIGVADVDCPGHSLCCFDGCSNYCVGQARAVVRPALVIPQNRINPAQARQPVASQVFEDVAAAQERCIDKIEHVEEIEYDEVEECHHSYDKKCHTSYSTEYESQQEEECDDNYKKECEITYSPHATNVSVAVCMTPLIKDCNLSGPEVCRTEYISECWTSNDPHTVVDDVPKCRTEYEEKCEVVQSGYVSEEKCKKWPREVCTIAKELRSKSNPVTKCEKVPQQLCGPAGCGFVPGPEQCHEEIKTVVTDIPNEVCDLTPQRRCSHVTKLVPKLTPVEECVDVPKEVCQKAKGNPRKVLKPITKKWCYVPSEESGLV